MVVAIASDEGEGFLGNPALLAVSYAHLAPLLEPAVKYRHLASLVKDEEVVAIIGRRTLDCDGWRDDDAAGVNLLIVLLLQGTNVGKHRDEQEQNSR